MCQPDKRRGEYGFWNDKCYFCDNFETVGFNEHYHFCPNCGAIFTYPILQRKHCEHIDENMPLLIRKPIYGYDRDRKPHVIKTYLLHNGPKQVCSVCGKWCCMDGW